MAGALLMLCLGVSACLLPQDEPQLIPPFRNQAPRIRPEKVNPPHSFQVDRPTLNQECPLPNIEVTVEDPNFSDPIYVKWMVFREDGTKDTRQVDVPLIEPRGTLDRPTLSPPDTLFTDTALADLAVDGGVSRHRLDLFIADAFLSFDAKGVPSARPMQPVPGPDGGPIENPSYIDSYSWIVTTVPRLCQ